MKFTESFEYATHDRRESLLWLLRLPRSLVSRCYDRLHCWLYFRLFYRHIDLVGKADIRIHPSTRLFMHDSKILVENGVLSIGYHPHGPSRDACSLRLQHSVLRVTGNVELRPGVGIWAMDATLAIGDGVVINGPATIVSKSRIEIGAHCLIAFNSTIMDSDLHKHGVLGGKAEDVAKPVMIGDRCWIGHNVTIVKGVTIGEGSIVGAHSVVTRDVEPHTMVAGVPASKIKENTIWEP